MKIDIVQHVGAVTRAVENRVHDGRPARVVVASRTYDTTVEDLWDALTSRERIPRWFLPISGDLRLGGRYQLEGNAGGTITHCEPPRHVAVTWEFGGQVTWVDARIDDTSDGRAHLTLEHIAHVPDAMWDQFGPGAVGVGWDLALAGLANHIATGESVKPSDGLAWLLSEDGREFVRRASDDWGRASIVSGTDQAAAHTAVARTTAAYSPPKEPAATETAG